MRFGKYGKMFLRVRDSWDARLSPWRAFGPRCGELARGGCAGVRQIECTVSKGERAGNAALEEIAVALAVRKDSFGVITNIRLDQLFPASRLLTEVTGAVVAPNKAVVGANAFAHEAGIHQDGIIKNPSTYEIISPETVGVPSRSLVMGKHSGRNALRVSLRDLGFEATDEELAEIYRRVTALADESKSVRPRDLLGIAHEVIRRGATTVAAEASSAV
jgi:2-isopropylmalate synthase